MRGLIALVLLLAGIASLVFGVGRLVGAIDGSPAAVLVVGAFLTLIGTRMVRGISGDDSEAPTHSPTSLGDHSLTTTAEPPQTRPAGAATSDHTTPARRAWLAVALALALAGLGAALAVGMLVRSQVDEAPNVAQHVLDACAESLRAERGAGASIGRAVAYETVGPGLAQVRFQTSQGEVWTCNYDVDLGVATVSN